MEDSSQMNGPSMLEIVEARVARRKAQSAHRWMLTRAVLFLVGVPLAWWGIARVLRVRWEFRVSDFHNLGDAFAPIAGALSAATLYLVVESIRMQREELALQRRELTLQREALQQQVREFELSRAELIEANRVQREANLIAGWQARLAASERLEPAVQAWELTRVRAINHCKIMLQQEFSQFEAEVSEGRFSDALARLRARELVSPPSGMLPLPLIFGDAAKLVRDAEAAWKFMRRMEALVETVPRTPTDRANTSDPAMNGAP